MNPYERLNQSRSAAEDATRAIPASPEASGDIAPTSSASREAAGSGLASPATPEAPDTRTALLAAGRALFARRGYDGASIRAITREAGANLGSVTYHFGGKEDLYAAVLESVVAPLAEKVQAVASSPGGSVDRTVEVIRTFFDHLQENPDLPHLVLQELAAGKDPPPAVQAFLGAVLGSLARILGEGQERGEVREGDPVLLGLSCVIQPIHLTLVGRWLGLIRGIDPSDPAQRSVLVSHAASFARAGLIRPQEGSS